MTEMRWTAREIASAIANRLWVNGAGQWPTASC